MKKRFICLTFGAVMTLLPFSHMAFAPMAMAEEPADDCEEEEDVTEDQEDDEADIRENAVIDFGEITDDDIDIPVPSFIKQNANHIIFNGADWSALRKAFANAEHGQVSIVHIGDSHIQADISTSTTRELLQYDFGNAGRGLITPLKMSGTNQPSNYTFSSPDSWQAVKLMSRNWERPMGFTGTSIHPARQQSSITLATSQTDDYNPFSSITLFHGGKLTVNSVTGENGQPVTFRAIPSRDYTQIILASAQTKVTVNFTSTGDLTLYGASLGGNKPGLFYHAIGNNGATLSTYNKIGTEGQGIAPLQPNLVIISLGTNEAFGHIDTSTFYHTIDRLVRSIQEANPSAQILLVTPMECQRSVSRTVSKKVKVPAKVSRSRSKSKKGRRRSSTGTRTKTVTSRVRSYQRNTNIAPLRNEILRYGKENGVAVLDWYEVAGGQGASDTWIANNLFSPDRVHHSYKGYHLQGRLLYDALIDALKNN